MRQMHIHRQGHEGQGQTQQPCARAVGMAEKDTYVEWSGSLHKGMTVVDIVPYPTTTPLLALAQQCGCPHTNGQAMIQGQSDAVLEYFDIL
jgi:shikimate 5-dehydrogenase